MPLSSRGPDTTIHRCAVFRRDPIWARWALAGVLGIWAFMTASILVCIVRYGRNLPWREDWGMVPALVGKEPNLFEWLWAQNNEHRLPLQKGAYLILLKIAGGDFRIGMIVNTLMIAGVCFGMIITARRLRGGQTRPADAFFPLVLIRLGHWENLVWGWQIQFVISTVMVGLWLLIIVREPWPLRPKIAVAAVLILVMLPLTGANGILLTPFVALWVTAGSLIYYREMRFGWVVPFQSICVLVSLVLAGLYFVGYVHPPWAPPNPGLVPTMITGARFVAMGLGPVGARHLEARLITGSVAFMVVSFLLASSVLPLKRGCTTERPSEKSRAIGLAVFMAAEAALAVAMAWGRAGWVPQFGMPDRYALFSVPILCAAYFAWILYGPARLRDRIGTMFLIAALAALPFNLLEGRSYGEYYVSGMKAFEEDLSRGLSWEQLADRHYEFLLRWDRNALLERMKMLHSAKIGPLGSAASR
jgi:hypothetical protein